MLEIDLATGICYKKNNLYSLHLSYTSSRYGCPGQKLVSDRVHKAFAILQENHNLPWIFLIVLDHEMLLYQNNIYLIDIILKYSLNYPLFPSLKLWVSGAFFYRNSYAIHVILVVVILFNSIQFFISRYIT